jgi:hypothetical protein
MPQQLLDNLQVSIVAGHGKRRPAVQIIIILGVDVSSNTQKQSNLGHVVRSSGIDQF